MANCTNEPNLNRILTKLGGDRKMTKTEYVPNEPNFNISCPKGIRTFALSLLPFAMILPNEPNSIDNRQALR
jgi:hypothetical protein